MNLRVTCGHQLFQAAAQEVGDMGNIRGRGNRGDRRHTGKLAGRSENRRPSEAVADQQGWGLDGSDPSRPRLRGDREYWR